MSNARKVCVIGGGASGMMAAIIAARQGAQVVIAEQLNRVGKKLLATGNGRCNLTNHDISIQRYHGKHPEFAVHAMEAFNYEATVDFFQELGIACKVEDGGKVFPWSDQASSILDVMRYEMESLNVKEMVDSEVKSIVPEKGCFRIIFKDGNSTYADRIILATGGKASPNLGSTGSGYMLARKLGHTTTEVFPSLVQLNLNAPFLKAIKGIKFIGNAGVYCDQTLIRQENGEILFTDYGISGPPVFQLSRSAGELLMKKDRPFLRLDMFPLLSERDLAGLLGKRFASRPSKSIEFSLVGMMNKKLIPVVLREAGIKDINTPCSSISYDDRNAIASLMKKWTFQITGTQSWGQAQVTAGGIDVCQVDPYTMESKLVPGVYFSGEILDIDGDCGGFNLQWAWSSGYCAGMNAAK